MKKNWILQFVFLIMPMTVFGQGVIHGGPQNNNAVAPSTATGSTATLGPNQAIIGAYLCHIQRTCSGNFGSYTTQMGIASCLQWQTIVVPNSCKPFRAEDYPNLPALKEDEALIDDKICQIQKNCVGNYTVTNGVESCLQWQTTVVPNSCRKIN